ncbi:hypothetical protein LJ737_06125 [Hymenobacter sp. 15J16-1T3B]|uniref:hypothetical protein n=1 Tax=Hymenobacter sp. 15J16-1T3B TaxID=2886941 RepID=UPI001D113145|nr:hypothetical protein [Hymenobacter sp. 15J16-1T3B]MCC3156804.1 hypothetical protein [Hymenobacter sp. 15J16-1T3B]
MNSSVTPAIRSAPTGWHLLNTVAASAALGVMLSPLLYELSVATGLLTPLQEASSSCGDTPTQWLTLRIGLIWGAVAGTALAAAQLLQRRRWAIAEVLLDLVALYLSLTLFRYGFVKVLATQFPRLWANLDTPPAELTPMRVAWQFFGYSRGYQQFLGWGEVVPAALLLVRRTRTLGAFIATVVMLNVFVVNVFFDVCVKIGSGSYLFFALLLLLQDVDRLWQFFIGHRPAALRTLPATASRFGRRGRLVYRGLGVLFTLAVIGLTALDVQGTREYAAEQAAVLPLTGVWETARAARWQAGRWQPLTPADSAYPARAYFQAAQAVLRNSVRRDRFVTEPDSARPKELIQLIARNENNDYAAPRRWQYQRTASDSLQLRGRWRRDSVQLVLHLNRGLMK